MATFYVARSPTLSQWASDVGLSKHVFKVGIAEEPVKAVVTRGWADLEDWILVKKQDAGDLTEAAVLERLAAKARLVDPALYPRLRGTPGVFKVLPAHVESRRLIVQALEDAGHARDPGDIGEGSLRAAAGKARPADFASYLIHHALQKAAEAGAEGAGAGQTGAAAPGR